MGIVNSVLLTYSILQVAPWHLIFNFIMSRDEGTDFNCEVVNRNTLQVNLISIYVYNKRMYNNPCTNNAIDTCSRYISKN